jgi:hypothetical protein
MSLEFVVTSEDPSLNKGLITALMGADKLALAYSGGSVFERIYFTTTEAVAVIKEGSRVEARHRMEKAMRSKIPYAKDVGLKMFLREAPDDGKKDSSVPSI